MGLVGSSIAHYPVFSWSFEPLQQQENNEQSAAGETFYEAIPTGEATTEESMYDYPKFSSEEDSHDYHPQPPAADRLPSVQQQANVTTIPEDPDYI